MSGDGGTGLWDAVFAAAVVHMIQPKHFDEKDAGGFEGIGGRVRVASRTAAALADSVWAEHLAQASAKNGKQGA